VAGWAPIVGLLLLAALQNVDVIMAKREMGDSEAGAYAAAAVAAKLVVWVAIGIGLHLLPEATRRAAAGDDPRGVLVRALGILAFVAVPSLAIFTIAPATLLRVAFGPDYVSAADALPILGLAMTLLAVSTLAVQYMLAVDRDNESVSAWFRTLHPAVLRAVSSVIKACSEAAMPLTICGEMAGSPFYLPILIGMGATELSMNVNSILRVRKVISGLAYQETAALVREIEKCRTADDVEALLERHIAEKWSHLIQPERQIRPRI